jgi:hypothetical protein
MSVNESLQEQQEEKRTVTTVSFEPEQFRAIRWWIDNVLKPKTDLSHYLETLLDKDAKEKGWLQKYKEKHKTV